MLAQLGGQDVSQDFHDLHRSDVLAKYEKLRIGRVEGRAAAPERSVSSIPYAENAWLSGVNSPYYSAAHLALQVPSRHPTK